MLAEQREGETAQFEGREQVGLEDVAPFLVGVVHGRLAGIGAGVVDQDLKSGAQVLDPVEDLAALLGVGDVGGERAHIRVRELLLEFIDGDIQRVLVARDDHHVGAQLQQLGGDRPADAGTRARDQRHLPVQTPAVRAHGHLLVAGA